MIAGNQHPLLSVLLHKIFKPLFRSLLIFYSFRLASIGRSEFMRTQCCHKGELGDQDLKKICKWAPSFYLKFFLACTLISHYLFVSSPTLLNSFLVFPCINRLLKMANRMYLFYYLWISPSSPSLVISHFPPPFHINRSSASSTTSTRWEHIQI